MGKCSKYESLWIERESFENCGMQLYRSYCSEKMASYFRGVLYLFSVIHAVGFHSIVCILLYSYSIFISICDLRNLSLDHWNAIIYVFDTTGFFSGQTSSVGVGIRISCAITVVPSHTSSKELLNVVISFIFIQYSLYYVLYI